MAQVKLRIFSKSEPDNIKSAFPKNWMSIPSAADPPGCGPGVAMPLIALPRKNLNTWEPAYSKDTGRLRKGG